MCMADITIGRKSWFRTNQIAGSGTIPADSKRVAVIMSMPCDSTHPVTWVMRLGPSVNGVTVGTITNASPTLIMRIEDYGQIVTQQLSAVEFEIAGNFLTVTEVFLNDAEEQEPEDE